MTRDNEGREGQENTILEEAGEWEVGKIIPILPANDISGPDIGTYRQEEDSSESKDWEKGKN